jgi:ZIP family zinc transporter
MPAALGWGTLAASSLVIGAIVALLIRINVRAIGLIMGFGAGVLISAVAFDLVEEAVDRASGRGAALAGVLAGCVVFFTRLAHQPFRRCRSQGRHRGSGERFSLAIVLGTVLDGIPESMVVGLTIFRGWSRGRGLSDCCLHLQPA